MILTIRTVFMLTFVLSACQTRGLNTSQIRDTQSTVTSIRSCEESLSRTQGFPFSTLGEGPEGQNFHEMAFYYACASQEWNFEKGFRSGNISLKSFLDPSRQNWRGLFEFPYWDVDLSQHAHITSDSVGKDAFCAEPNQNPCTKKRIFANPHDTIHVRVLRQAFGEPTGFMPAIMTSSVRTVLVLPPSAAAFFLKMPGQTLLNSPLKALVPEEILESLYHSQQLSSSVPSIYPEREGLILKASFLLPDMANFVELDFDEYSSRYPEDRYPRRYTLLKREFPELQRLVKPNQKTLLLPGHSLLSKSFLESELGMKMAGSTEAERFEWARQWIWPTVSKFIVSSMFDHGIHFEAHFQNMDFLLALDDNDRVQDIAVLMKDLGDLVADPVLQVIQGRSVSEPILAAGPWAEQHRYSKEALLAKKYGGKFGMLEPSDIFGQNTNHPEWAVSLRKSLADAFAKFTANRNIPAQVLIKDKELNDFIYASQSPNRLPQLDLGKSVSNMRALVVRSYVRLNVSWDPIESQEKKEAFIKRYSQSEGLVNGLETDCFLPQTFRDTFSSEAAKFRHGVLPFPGDPKRSIEILALQNPDESIDCLVISAPIKTISLTDFSNSL